VLLVQGAGEFTSPGAAPNHWVEQLRVADLSVGTYSIPAGGDDDQTPHSEDEIYVVQHGRARLVAGGGSVHVGPGSVVYVPAGESHRFTDVAEDLAILVLFAPPYRSRATTPNAPAS
jgi:mannose-6-phosphate isomerase-like protein (cupin superfamily)